MTVTDFNTSVRYTLQDTAGAKWADAEILDYINEGLRDIALMTFNQYVSEDLSVVVGTDTYTLARSPIKVLRIDTLQSITQPTINTVKFADPKAETVNVEYYAYPVAVTTDINEEADIIDALKKFVLSRCYEKEDLTEHFGKAAHFKQEYINYLNQNMTRWQDNIPVTLYQGDFLS